MRARRGAVTRHTCATLDHDPVLRRVWWGVQLGDDKVGIGGGPNLQFDAQKLLLHVGHPD